ncbi:MAG: hypothetical protein PWQ39_18 [Thermacetogenium sp.]|nr:hypothetical protein [Thermacetogenium sp.]
MIFYTVQHVLILRLLICYKIKSVATIHNLLFLVSAAKNEEQELAFYDFVRTRSGAYSRGIQRIIDELKQEKLIEETEDSIRITQRGMHIYSNLGASLNAFPSFWNLCMKIMEQYADAPESIIKRVFYNITFRRAKIGERIFSYGWS